MKKRFVFTGEFNEDNVAKFFADYHAGSLQPHIRSEPVPGAFARALHASQHAAADVA
jgi:hypothetical protein